MLFSIIFIFLVWAARSLPCFTGLSLVAGSGGHALVAGSGGHALVSVRALLIALAPLVAERGL